MERVLPTTTPDVRVLTLLHLLGEDAANEVLNRLDAPMTSLLRNRLKNFSAELPPLRKQQQILDEFERFFRFAVKSAPPTLRLHTEEDASGEDDQSEGDDYTLSGDPLVDLEKMNVYQLGAALNDEQPRTVALLLKSVNAKRVAQILRLLSEDRRESVVRELSRDPRASDVVLRKIAATTVARAITLPTEPPRQEDPVQRLVEVLRATDKPQRRKILRVIEDQDPEKAQRINHSLYQFEDLMGLDDQKVQQVLSKVDSTTLSTALFGADEQILAKIINNLSRRARETLQEELSFRKNVPGSQLKAARDLVVHAIAEADQEAE